jgi:hypothetical protein
MTEMSKPAEILYRAFHDELRFAKQQQWTITYYSVLLIGAGVGLARATLPMSCGRVVWFGLVALAMLTHSYLVFHLQRYMQTTRARQWRMEETFSPEDRRLARNEPPAERADARGPIEPFVVVLCAVVAVAGILAGYAIWQL